MKKSEQLVWNVYVYGMGDRTFRVFNAFDHGSFLADVQKILKADLAKEEFTEKLRREVQYNVGCMHWNYEPVTLDEILTVKTSGDNS